MKGQRPKVARELGHVPAQSTDALVAVVYAVALFTQATGIEAIAWAIVRKDAHGTAVGQAIELRIVPLKATAPKQTLRAKTGLDIAQAIARQIGAAVMTT